MVSAAASRFNRGDRAILIAAIFWGTVWVPVRELDAAAAGLGSWPMMVSDAIATALGLVLAACNRRTIAADPIRWLAIAILGASAYVLYVEALIDGRVGRTLILFYLMPVWATLLERIVLGMRLTLDRIVALVLGLSGLGVMMGHDLLGGGVSLSDGLALVSGLVFAIAVTLINRTPHMTAATKVGGIFAATAPIFALVTLLPGGNEPLAVVGFGPDVWIWVVAHAVVWFIPAFWLSIYGAGLTLPGRAAIFFMGEVLLGIITAALFAGEMITGREAVGAVLVILAGLVEGVGLEWLRRRRPDPT